MFTVGTSCCLIEENILMKDYLKRFWTLDNMGLGENENQDDKSIIEQFEKYLQFYYSKYVTCLLWKSNHENLGNNLENAKRRLMSLAKTIKK